MTVSLPSADCHNCFTQALVAVGSNVSSASGPPEATVAEAVAELARRAGQTLRVSRFFRNPAFPAGSGPDFVNAALALDWTGSAEDLLDILHRIEADFGRTRRQRWAARVLDLDLLALGDTVLPDAATQDRWREIPADTAAQAAPDRIIVPHPRLQERGFVLVPLADIAPDWRHPRTGQSVSAMLSALPPDALCEIVPIAGSLPLSIPHVADK